MPWICASESRYPRDSIRSTDNGDSRSGERCQRALQSASRIRRARSVVDRRHRRIRREEHAILVVKQDLGQELQRQYLAPPIRLEAVTLYGPVAEHDGDAGHLAPMRSVEQRIVRAIRCRAAVEVIEAVEKHIHQKTELFVQPRPVAELSMPERSRIAGLNRAFAPRTTRSPSADSSRPFRW